MVKSIEHFAVYLLGRPFILQTDHKALLKLRTMQNGNHRLMRWSLALQPYQFTVKHRPGRELTNAHGLSRQADGEPLATEGRGGVRDNPPDTAALTGNPLNQDAGGFEKQIIIAPIQN